MNDAELVYVIVTACLFFSIFVSTSVWCYIAYTKKAEMLGLLSNCRQMQGRSASSIKGKWGHLLMMMDISTILTYPKLSVKKLGADPEDIKKFPRKLRNIIVYSQIITAVEFSVMCALAVVDEYTDWLT